MADNWYVVLELEFDPPVEDESIISQRICEKSKIWSTHFYHYKNGHQYRKWHQSIPQIKKDMLGESNIRKQIAAEACNIVYGPIDRIIKIIGRNGIITEDECERISEKLKVDVSVIKKRAKKCGIECFGKTQKEKEETAGENNNEFVNESYYKGIKRFLDVFNADNLYDFLYAGTFINNANCLPCETLRQRAKERKKNEFNKIDYVSSEGSKLCAICELVFKDETNKALYDYYLKASNNSKTLEEVKTIYEICGYLPEEFVREVVCRLLKENGELETVIDLFNKFCESHNIPIDINATIQYALEYVDEKRQNVIRSSLEVFNGEIRYAYLNEKEEAVFPQKENGESFVDTYCYCSDDVLLVGSDAKEMNVIEPDNTIMIDPGLLKIQGKIGNFNGRALSAEEALSRIIKSIIKTRDYNKLVLTLPTYFNYTTAFPIMRAVHNSGVEIVDVISHAAAIVEYLKGDQKVQFRREEKIIIVYISKKSVYFDLVQWKFGDLIICNSYEYSYGYSEVNELIANYILCERNNHADSLRFFAGLGIEENLHKADTIRKKLVKNDDVTAQLFSIVDGSPRRLTITREELSDVCDDYITQLLSKFESTLKELKLEERINSKVVIVGNGVETLLLQKVLQNKEFDACYYSDEIIAEGALLVSRNI